MFNWREWIARNLTSLNLNGNILWLHKALKHLLSAKLPPKEYKTFIYTECKPFSKHTSCIKQKISALSYDFIVNFLAILVYLLCIWIDFSRNHKYNESSKSNYLFKRNSKETNYLEKAKIFCQKKKKDDYLWIFLLS